MTNTISKNCMNIKRNINLVSFLFVCLLTLFEMSFAFANTPLEYNILPSLKENSIVDTKAQKKLMFSVIDDQQTIFYNNKKVAIQNNSFSVDISKLTGKADVILSTSDGDSISFSYIFSNKNGLLTDYELVPGKDLKTYVTTVKGIKIIYSDKEKSTVSKLKSYLNKVPKNVISNLKEIKMIPYSNTSNIAGTTKNGVVTLYNFSKYTAGTQKNIIYHEIAHTWASKLMDKKIIDYSYTEYNEIVEKDNNFVSSYAKDFAKDNNGKLSEDFADSIAFYIINQSSFKKQYPNRTIYIKELLKKEM